MQTGLLEIRMGFDLVDSRGNLSRLKKVVNLVLGKIANTNASDLFSLHELLQSSPCIGDRNVRQPESLRDRIDRRESFVCMFKCDGPVDLTKLERVSVLNVIQGRTNQV